MKISSLLVFVVVSGFALNAQTKLLHADKNRHYTVRSWSENTFNPGGTMGKIIQDDDGFLWIGSNNGLFKFDGFRFLQYTIDNTPDIKSTLISDLYKGKDGIVYLSNSAGGLLSIKKQGNGHKIVNMNLPPGLLSFITGDNKGTIWANVPANGIYKINKTQRSFYKNKDYLPDTRVSSMLWNETTGLWIGVRGSSVINFSETKNHRIYKLKDEIPTVLSFLRNGELWVGTNKGLYILKDKTIFKPEQFKFLENENISSIVQDDKDNVWVGTRNNGLYIIKSDGEYTHLTKETGLSGNEITSLCYSKEKIMWVSLTVGGMNAIEESRIIVLSAPEFLPHAVVRSIYRENATSIWFGTDSGLVNFNENGRKVYLANIGLPSGQVMSSMVGDNGDLYVGTREGLAVVRHGKVIRVFDEKKGLKSDFVRIIYKDEDGSIWVGTNGGGITILRGDSIAYLNKNNGLSDNFISFIHRTRKGDLWIGTTGGGVNILKKNGTFKYLNTGNGLRVNTVVSICETEDGTVWFSSNGGGIIRVKADFIFSFNLTHGLPDNRVFKIIKDKGGRYWCSTRRGVFTFEESDALQVMMGKKRTLSISLYGKNDGMLSERCNGLTNQSGMLSDEGDIYFATTNGAAIFNLNLPDLDDINIPVYIYETVVDEKIMVPAEEMNLAAGTNHVSFHFSGLSLRNSSRINFQYKMEGLESHWQNAKAENAASYNNLPPGSYIFAVSAKNSDGRTSKFTARIPVNVQPYFYQTIWFRILGIILLTVIVAFVVRSELNKRYKKELQKMEARHALENERMRISKDMHDEMGASLTKLSLLSEIAKKKIGDPLAILFQLEKLSDTARSMSATMDEIVWAINPRNDTLENLIGYILRFAEDLFSYSAIELKVNIPEVIPEMEIPAEMRHNVFLTTKEALNNAVKYSEAAQVLLRISLQDNIFETAVSDDGKGFNITQAEKSGRNGLNNMKKRMQEIGAEFSLQSEAGKGTEMLIKYEFSKKTHT